LAAAVPRGAAGAASAMAGCATLFLSFWLLSILMTMIFPHSWDRHDWPWWRPIVSVGMVVCAAAVARYVWRLILPGSGRGRPGDQPGQAAAGETHDAGGSGPAGVRDAAGRGASSGFGVAFRWAFLTTLLAFAVMFFTPLVIGGSSTGPLFAIIYAPAIFVITLILALISPRLGIVTIVASLLFPVWYYVQTPHQRPEGTLVPLTTEERALIRSRHFALHVGVDAGRVPPIPPIYRDNLIRDLVRTGLFDEVGSVEATRSADLIATVTGTYWGDTTGHSFSLSWTKEPERKVNVNVWHDEPPQFLQRCKIMSVSPRKRTLDSGRASHRGQVFACFSGLLSSSAELSSMLPATVKAILSNSPASSQRLPDCSQMSYDNSPCLVMTS
jgi:hypothetical protein